MTPVRKPASSPTTKEKSSNELHVLAVGAALLLGAIGSIFVAQPLFDSENAWHAPIHEHLNALLPKEWRWHGKNAILAALNIAVVSVPTFLAYVCVPNRFGKTRGDQSPVAESPERPSVGGD